MKKTIHPTYVTTVIPCSCGKTIVTRSAGHDMHVETCSSCHPFYTGNQRQLDTDGRIGRFYKRFHI